MTAYYNEFDPDAAAWLRELIADGLIAPGDVDERSITEVHPSDLADFEQCHFFAGIGGWSYALRLAQWPDNKPVWTASLPCQPFSTAGKQLGKQDERHLLPHFLELVRQCKPATVFGEQVERAIGSTGVRDKTQDLQSLQTRAAYLRVLTELQRQGGKTLQELQSMGKGQQAREEGEKFSCVSRLENEESRCCFSKYSNPSSQRKRNAIGYNCGLGASEDRCGSMRGYGDIVRSGYAESVECPVIRQDRQQQRLYNNEYPCGDLCPECNDEYMGAAEDIGGIEWNNESAQESISIAYRKTSEQIERATVTGWLDDLQATMEAENYAVGHCVLGAHSIGAAHIRQRLYWVADSNIKGSQGWARTERTNKFIAGQNGMVDGMADTSGQQREQQQDERSAGIFRAPIQSEKCVSRPSDIRATSNIDWIYCRDNKYRPIESGIKPLVDGLPRGMVHSSDSRNTQEARKMRLKGYGNAIVPALAAEFIMAYTKSMIRR